MIDKTTTRGEANSAIMRLDNITDMLQALQLSSFRAAEEAITESKLSCYDWVVCNYQLVSSVINELVYLLPEQLEIINNYISCSDSAAETGEEA